MKYNITLNIENNLVNIVIKENFNEIWLKTSVSLINKATSYVTIVIYTLRILGPV